jgi:hypothetical protein
MSHRRHHRRTPAGQGVPVTGTPDIGDALPSVDAAPRHLPPPEPLRARSLTPEILSTMARASGSQVPVAQAKRSWRDGMPRWVQVVAAIGIPVTVAVGAHRLSTPAGFDVASAQRPTPPAFSQPAAAPVASGGIESEPVPVFSASIRQLGHSGEVGIRTTLPGDSLVLPYNASSDATGTTFEWAAMDGAPGEMAGAWEPSEVLRAPVRPGAYQLVASRGGIVDTLREFTWLVMRPMPSTRAVGLNGYHLGAWPRAAQGEVPPGFVEITREIADLQLTQHLRLQDFVVHDGQDGFPKYLYLRPALLDKLELVVQEIAKVRSVSPERVELRVASGFRSPSHNAGLSGSARDSRHMYGDAADVAIDVNNDGRLTELDARIVALAAEMVEARHPDLVGGIGIYINTSGGGWPYVHIDVRGSRARWRGSRASAEAADETTNSRATVGEVIGDSTAKPTVDGPDSAAVSAPATAPAPTATAPGAPASTAPAKPSPRAPQTSPTPPAQTPAATPAPAAATTRPAPSTPPADADPFAEASRKFRAPPPQTSPRRPKPE